MKKKLILSIISVSIILLGCKENQTGLQKDVINSAYDNCYTNLSKTLKSPSSLRVKESLVGVSTPEVNDVYRLYADEIIKDNKISALTHDSKTRFRMLSVNLNYEAQNSFGVYLPGSFECSYMYKLGEDRQSPSELDLFLIQSDDEKIELNKPIYNFKDSSNLKLTDSINKVVGDSNAYIFNANDEAMFSKLLEQSKDEKEDIEREKEAQRIKKSLGWDKY
ncbi:hypothetical protein [Acinetobacter sp. ANC 5502]